MKRTVAFILLYVLLSCNQSGSKPDSDFELTENQSYFDSLLKSSYECVAMAEQFVRERDSLSAVLYAYKYVDSCNAVVFGKQRNYLRVSSKN